ncbi:MAG: rRNA maturation RNase YbeY [Bacteroidetes bacterium]|nr:rRNA maturation RNase YbeY [Bacteroidota bacterium]
MSKITFFSEEIAFDLKQKRWVKEWITTVIASEKKKAGAISYIFCDDNYLIQLNQQYLKHDTLTDIITFDYTSDNDGLISGDIFISIERVKENAANLHTAFYEELHRVMIHGVLHLLGYKDKTRAEKLLMRQKEDNSLSLQNK